MKHKPLAYALPHLKPLRYVIVNMKHNSFLRCGADKSQTQRLWVRTIHRYTINITDSDNTKRCGQVRRAGSANRAVQGMVSRSVQAIYNHARWS